MDSLISGLERQSRMEMVKWITTALISGVVGTLVLQFFIFLARGIGSFINSFPVPLIIWPVAGALFTGAVIYRIEIRASAEGIPAYIRGIALEKGHLSFRVTFFKFFAALATLGTFGDGGIVGPLGRVAAGTAGFIARGFKKMSPQYIQEDIRMAGICGMAGLTAAVFHSPLGAGIFAVEMIQRRSLNYSDLFPAILSSATAVFFSKAMGWRCYYCLEVPNAFMDLRMILPLIIFSLIMGYTGGFYNLTYRKIASLFRRAQGKIIPKLVVGSVISFMLANSVNPGLMGTSDALFNAVIKGHFDVITGSLTPFGNTGLLIVFIVIINILSNCITVGCGMNAGFTGPAILTGMLLGASSALFLGLEFGTPNYYMFLAAGFSGMLSSTLKVPMSAAIITIEAFGLAYSFPAGVAALIGFQIIKQTRIFNPANP